MIKPNKSYYLIKNITLILGMTLIMGCDGKLPSLRLGLQINKPTLPEKIFEKNGAAIVRIHAMGTDGIASRSGTGFILKADQEKYIITNKHVTENQDLVIVEAENATWISTYRKEHPELDISILPIELLPQDKLNMASLELHKGIPKEGQIIYTIGHPLGFNIAIYEGMINSLFKGKLVFSAPLSEGASGSPLLTPSGEVIGVCDSYIAGAQNYNLATPLIKGWDNTNWKIKEAAIDPDLKNYINRISMIKSKVSGTKKELKILSANNKKLRDWKNRTAWTREELTEAAKNVCISFISINWQAIKNPSNYSLLKKEAILLQTSSLELKRSWQSHKKNIETNKSPLNLDLGLIGFAETEKFVEQALKLSQALKTYIETKDSDNHNLKDTLAVQKNLDEKAAPAKTSLIAAIVAYKEAEDKFLKVGTP
jgi:hypothetical protein